MRRIAAIAVRNRDEAAAYRAEVAMLVRRFGLTPTNRPR